VGDDDGFITLPPGIFDSGTFKTPIRPARTRADKPDIVFVPTVPGAPLPPVPPPAEPTPSVPSPAEPPAPATQPAAPAPHEIASDPSEETRRDIGEDFMPPVSPGAPEARPAVAWGVVLGDGSSLAIEGRVLVGRNPALVEGWESASLMPIFDPTQSVSKTHAAFEVDDSGLWVHDLASTNGVWVVVGEDATEVAPGRRVAVADGAVIELGDYVLRAVRR